MNLFESERNALLPLPLSRTMGAAYVRRAGGSCDAMMGRVESDSRVTPRWSNRSLAKRPAGNVRAPKSLHATAVMRGRQICIIFMSDIDAWLHGTSERNVGLASWEFVPGVTEAGLAPGAYA